MKFLCDVHISIKLTKFIQSKGFVCIHIKDILQGNLSTDKEICNYADKNDFIVITKDSDFRNSFFILNTPKKLIKINLGNISNKELIEIFDLFLNKFQTNFSSENKYIEINKNSISIY